MNREMMLMRMVMVVLLLTLVACGPGEPAAPAAVTSVQGALLNEAPIAAPEVPEVSIEQPRETDADSLPVDGETVGTGEPLSDASSEPVAQAEPELIPWDPSEYAPPPLPVPEVAGHVSVSFDTLSSYQYATPDDVNTFPEAADLARMGDDQIPRAIRDLHGKKIVIVGYMIPIDIQQQTTREFLLLPVMPHCLYCRRPSITQWIECKTTDGSRLAFYDNEPVVITGTLHVGAEMTDGWITSIYRMDVQSVTRLGNE